MWSRTTSGSRLEPLTLLGALAAVTKHIGLVATMTTTYYEPFTIARMFASLDHISGGRAGWNLVTSLAAAEALNFSHAAHAAHGDRYARAKEFAHVVLGTCGTRGKTAPLSPTRNRASFFDPEKLHFLNHKGKNFQVRGPLMIQRSQQGHPVIVQAGQSDDGRDLAAETAEVIFTVQQDLEQGRAFYSDIKRRAVAYGRSPDSVKVLPGVMTVVGRTRAEAEDKYEKLQGADSPGLWRQAALDLLRPRSFGVFPLDGPVPEPNYADAEPRPASKVMVDLGARGKTFHRSGNSTSASSRPARPSHGLRHTRGDRRCTGTLVRRRRLRRLQRAADLTFPTRPATISSPRLFRKSAAPRPVSDPNTKARTLRENLDLADAGQPVVTQRRASEIQRRGR